MAWVRRMTSIVLICFCALALFECHYFSMKYLRHLIPQARIENATIAKATAHSLTTCNLKCVNKKSCISNLFFIAKNKCILLRSFFQQTQQFGETAQLDNSTKVVVSQSTDACSLNPCSENTTCFGNSSGIVCATGFSSCLDIRNKNKTSPSGFYRIWFDPSKTSTIKVFCDMETAGGGWLQVMKVKSETNSFTEFLKVPFRVWQKLTDFAPSGNYMIEPTALAKLSLSGNFTQFRFKCKVPQSNKVLHLMTTKKATGMAVVDWIFGKTSQRPTSCGSYERLKDDNSILAQNCRDWSSKVWGHSGTVDFQSHMMWIYGAAHWNLNLAFNRFECDNFRSNGNIIGTGEIWEIFAR